LRISVIAGEAKQSRPALPPLDCFVATLLAMTALYAAANTAFLTASGKLID
jgi:hypothetical protein